jgi:hypothetical protein
MQKNPTLTLDDLDLSDIQIQALNKEEFIGVPEFGASASINNCCSNSCNPPPTPVPVETDI